MNARLTNALAIAILASTLALACSQAGPAGGEAGGRGAPPAAMGEAPKQVAPAEAESDATAAGKSEGAPAQQEPMIVRRAEVSVQVTDLPKAARALETRARSFGGYIASSTLYHGESPTGSLLVRIPARSLDAFLGGLAAVGTILSESLASDDVGLEFQDLQARLRNWAAEERRLQELFSRSGKVTDLLEVERELARVRGEMEQATARRNFLANQVSYSTVTLTLSVAAVPRTPAGWNPLAVAKEAGAALWEVAIGLISSAIWIGVFVPLWLPAYLLVRWLWGRRRRKPATAN
ncbi:MAG: DUF4349 domain-containing protein [Candidatus Sericytochromatia bacterium]|nr:DUF4349 domain-containing protein [Candidatus Tanganyikabacteria bacterium]